MGDRQELGFLGEDGITSPLRVSRTTST